MIFSIDTIFMRIKIIKLLAVFSLFFLSSRDLYGQTTLKITKFNGQATQSVAVPVIVNGKVQGNNVMKLYLTYRVSGSVNNASAQEAFGVRFTYQDFSTPQNKPNLDCLYKISDAGTKGGPVTLTLTPKTVNRSGIWDITPSNLLGCAY